ncbi:hypothetical protein CsSME_00019483 [Camellia sinensis var. sinensis]
MENFRSKSCRDGRMQIESSFNGGRPTRPSHPTSMHDLRSYSTSYATSSSENQTSLPIEQRFLPSAPPWAADPFSETSPSPPHARGLASSATPAASPRSTSPEWDSLLQPLLSLHYVKQLAGLCPLVSRKTTRSIPVSVPYTSW